MRTMTKRCVLLIFSALIFLGNVFAQAPAGYYAPANGKNGAALKTSLHNVVKGHAERTYKDLWTDMVSTDSKSDGKVWDMYSNCVFNWGVPPSGNQDQGSGGTAECQFYNREHSFPKSWFDDGYPMYTDLFHLIPTDKYVNGKRGNHPFGEVGSVTQTFVNGCKLGSAKADLGYSGTVFEPTNEYKGDFARTYFYMATRYDNVVAGWYANAEAKPMLNGTAYPAFQTWAVSMLLKWHRQDPVSQKEVNRNNAVYGIQHNRNPFIDHPELAEYVWGDSITSAWSGGGSNEGEGEDPPTSVTTAAAVADFSVMPNPASWEFSLALPDGVLLQKVEIFDTNGILLLTQSGSEAKVYLTAIKVGGIYVIRVTTNKGSGSQLLRVAR